MKVAIVVGHTVKKQGSVSIFGKTEYDYAVEVAHYLGLPTFEFNPDMGYKTGCYDLKEKIKGFDLILHLHFNSFHNDKASGCECLYYHTSNIGEKLAELYIKTITEYYDTKPRSPLPIVDDSQRGYHAFCIDGVNLILEPFFGSNKECMKFKDSEDYAKTIAMFIDKAQKKWHEL